MAINIEQLRQLINVYKPIGIVSGREFLLHPDDALRLADDLGKIGIRLVGADGWYYANRELNYLVEDPGIGCSVSDDFSESVEETIALVRNFITTKLPEHIEFVALTPDFPFDQYRLLYMP